MFEEIIEKFWKVLLAFTNPCWGLAGIILKGFKQKSKKRRKGKERESQKRRGRGEAEAAVQAEQGHSINSLSVQQQPGRRDEERKAGIDQSGRH